MRRLLLAMMLVCAATQAAAHAQLRAAEPAMGAVVPSAPETVRLTFNEPIAPLAASWIAPDGARTEIAATAEGEVLVIPTPADPPRGTHVLSWRVVSADGHPVGGTHVFSIGAAGELPAFEASVSAATPWVAGARFALTAALAFGVGGVAVAALAGAPVTTATRAAALAVFPAALALAGLEAMDLAAAPWSAALSPAVWVGLAASPMAVALTLAAVSAGLALAAGRRRRWLAVLAWAAAAASFAAAGHAATAAPRWLTAPAVWVHALAALFWVGAFPPLLAALGRPDAATVVRRFSRVATPLVALLVASGGALAAVQIGSPDALDTAYGRVWLAKVALAALLLGLALYNRLALTPALVAGDGTAKLRSSIRVELAVGLAILALSAGFRLTPPPRALATAPAGIEVHLHGRLAMADVTIAPGRRGENRITLTMLDGDFQPATPLEVTVSLRPPGQGLEPIRATASRGEDGLWRAGPVFLPTPGVWDVVAEVLVSDFDLERIGAEVFVAP